MGTKGGRVAVSYVGMNWIEGSRGQGADIVGHGRERGRRS